MMMTQLDWDELEARLSALERQLTSHRLEQLQDTLVQLTRFREELRELYIQLSEAADENKVEVEVERLERFIDRVEWQRRAGDIKLGVKDPRRCQLRRERLPGALPHKLTVVHLNKGEHVYTPWFPSSLFADTFGALIRSQRVNDRQLRAAGCNVVLTATADLLLLVSLHQLGRYEDIDSVGPILGFARRTLTYQRQVVVEIQTGTVVPRSALKRGLSIALLQNVSLAIVNEGEVAIALPSLKNGDDREQRVLIISQQALAEEEIAAAEPVTAAAPVIVEPPIPVAQPEIVAPPAAPRRSKSHNLFRRQLTPVG